MAAVPPFVAKKLVESLQTDLRTLSTDCKRKYPPVKEVGLDLVRQINIDNKNFKLIFYNFFYCIIGNVNIIHYMLFEF